MKAYILCYSQELYLKDKGHAESLHPLLFSRTCLKDEGHAESLHPLLFPRTLPKRRRAC